MRDQPNNSDAPIACAFFVYGVLALIPSLISLCFFIWLGVRTLPQMLSHPQGWLAGMYPPALAFGCVFFIMWGLAQFIEYAFRMRGRRWKFKPTTLWASTIAYNAIIFTSATVCFVNELAWTSTDPLVCIMPVWTGLWLMLGVVGLYQVLQD